MRKRDQPADFQWQWEWRPHLSWIGPTLSHLGGACLDERLAQYLLPDVHTNLFGLKSTIGAISKPWPYRPDIYTTIQITSLWMTQTNCWLCLLLKRVTKTLHYKREGLVQDLVYGMEAAQHSTILALYCWDDNFLELRAWLGLRGICKCREKDGNMPVQLHPEDCLQNEWHTFQHL